MNRLSSRDKEILTQLVQEVGTGAAVEIFHRLTGKWISRSEAQAAKHEEWPLVYQRPMTFGKTIRGKYLDS